VGMRVCARAFACVRCVCVCVCVRLWVCACACAHDVFASVCA
jgi:hypothetical protein